MKVTICEAENLEEEVVAEISQVLAGLAFAKNVVDVVKVVKVSALEHLALTESRYHSRRRDSGTTSSWTR